LSKSGDRNVLQTDPCIGRNEDEFACVQIAFLFPEQDVSFAGMDQYDFVLGGIL